MHPIGQKQHTPTATETITKSEAILGPGALFQQAQANTATRTHSHNTPLFIRWVGKDAQKPHSETDQGSL